MSQFEYRLLKEEDYDQLVEWWKWHRFPVPERELLPNNGCSGVMVSLDGINCCAGFIYLTNSPIVAWSEYIVSNPKIKDKEKREESLLFLIETISLLAKKSGCRLLFTTLNHESLKEKYIKSGFQIASKNTVEMIKAL